MFFLHCPKSQYTRLEKPEAIRTPKKYARLGKPDAIQLRPYASWKNREENIPHAQGKYHINVGTQFHCVRNTHTKKIHTPRKTGRNTIASLRAMEKLSAKHTARKTGRNIIASLRVMEKLSAKHTARETGRNTIASLRVMGKPSAIRTPREKIRTPRGNREEKYTHTQRKTCLYVLPPHATG